MFLFAGRKAQLRSGENRRSVGLCVLIVCCVMFMIVCHRTRADEAPALTHLTYRAPAAAGCMPAREIEGDVEALLGRKVFVERTSASQELVVRVERREGEWVASLQLGAHDNVRQISSNGDCASLSRPLAIVIATLLDTWLESAATKQSAPSLSLGVGLDARSGVLPKLALGVRAMGLLTAAQGWPMLRGEVGAWLPEHVARDGVGARFTALQAGLAVCPRLLAQGDLTLALCVGVEVGALWARAQGLTAARAPARLIVSLPLEAALSLRLFAALSLRIELGPTFEALRPSFYFDAADEQPHVVHRVGLWGGSARLALVADLF